MAIFVIGDLHLSLSELVGKPMDIFGPEWVNHSERLKEEWETTVNPEDTVLVAGDISWALKLSEAMIDLEFINSLPGKKILIKGNHDLWWTGIGKLNNLFPEGMTFLQNTCGEAEGIAICGTRGWICPGTEAFDDHDQKIYNREVLRLKMSLDSAVAAGFEEIIGILHYPPTNDKFHPSGFTELFEAYGVKKVAYGHLHSKEAFKKGLQGDFYGVEYHLASLDYLNCKPFRLK